MSRSFIASYKFFPIQKKSHQTIYFLTVEAMRHCTEGNMPQEIKFDQVTGIFAITSFSKEDSIKTISWSFDFAFGLNKHFLKFVQVHFEL